MPLTLPISVDYARAGTQPAQPQASISLYLLPCSPEIPQQMKRPMVIVCPGGGYAYRSVREAEPIAMKFLAAGMHAAVLHYSVAPNRYPAAALELASCVQLCRSQAAQWHIDPERIYVIGFSAGGHVACTLGTLWHDPLFARVLGDGPSWRPNAQILCYPVITLGEFAHVGSRNNLLGENATQEMIDALSLETRVSADTVPTFLWHTVTDGSVPVENSLQYAAALRRHQVPFELHLYENGPHGLATCDAITATKPEQLVPDAAGWIDHALRFLARRA